MAPEMDARERASWSANKLPFSLHQALSLNPGNTHVIRVSPNRAIGSQIVVVSVHSSVNVMMLDVLKQKDRECGEGLSIEL